MGTTRSVRLLLGASVLVAIALAASALRPRASHADVHTDVHTVAPRTAFASPTSFTGSVDQLPDCIPVDSRSTPDVGCELKSDFEAIAPDPSPGIPVYDDKGATRGHVVGYIVPGIDQFVPTSIANDPQSLAKLTVCNSEFLRSQPLDDGCAPLLEAMGTRLGG